MRANIYTNNAGPRRLRQSTRAGGMGAVKFANRNDDAMGEGEQQPSGNRVHEVDDDDDDYSDNDQTIRAVCCLFNVF